MFWRFKPSNICLIHLVAFYLTHRVKRAIESIVSRPLKTIAHLPPRMTNMNSIIVESVAVLQLGPIFNHYQKDKLLIYKKNVLKIQAVKYMFNTFSCFLSNTPGQASYWVHRRMRLSVNYWYFISSDRCL
jgi:hypothetical protein